ncbi:MAG: twin-arginine translocase TatA/TatE family subunit [Planctomycetota bacterium]
MASLGLLPNLGPVEIGVLLVLGLLIFGRRLPEVGRGLGKSIVEFKRGLKDATDEIDQVQSEVKSDVGSEPASQGQLDSGGPSTGAPGTLPQQARVGEGSERPAG